MSSADRQSRTPIRNALKDRSSLQPAVRDGIEAIEDQDRHYVAQVRSTIGDSLNLDRALVDELPNDKRWDYVLGCTASTMVVGVEVHKAEEGEVRTVIAKKRAAMDQLGPHLTAGKRVSKWVWVATSKVHFANTEKIRLRLDQNGISFVARGLQAKDLR